MIDPALRLRRAVNRHDLTLTRRILKAHPDLIRNPDTSPLGQTNTNLHLACRIDDLPIVSLLLELGHEDAGISMNSHHETPLMIAAQLGCTEIVNKLCTMGEHIAGVTRRDLKGRDALMFASMHGFDTCVQILLTFAPPITLSWIVQHTDISPQQAAELTPPKALLMNRDAEGNTALHHAAAFGHLLVVRTLLAAGADPYKNNVYHWLAVHYSISKEAEAYMVELVLDMELRSRIAKEKRAAFAESHVERDMGHGLGIKDVDEMRGKSLRIVQDD